MAISRSKRARFTEKFHEQLRFLERSCQAFDQGAEDEAIRLAASLRIIFHSTSRVTSLVTHLRLAPRKMLSSTRGLGDWKDYLSIQLDLVSPQPVKALPILGTQFKELTIEKWWSEEPVFIYLGKGHSRRQIILSIADKDGGAHVDEKLEEYYEHLCAGEYGIGIQTDNLEFDGKHPFEQGITHYPKNVHLALVRQFAHEVLATVTHYSWLKDES